MILSDQRYPEAPNWSDLGATFSLPKDVFFHSNAARSYLAGTYEFGVEEYEVFGVKC